MESLCGRTSKTPRVVAGNKRKAIMSGVPQHAATIWEALEKTYDDTDDIPEEEDPLQQDTGEEEWEKGVPPFVKKLTNMVSENKSIINTPNFFYTLFVYLLLFMHLTTFYMFFTGQWKVLLLSKTLICLQMCCLGILKTLSSVVL